MASSSMVVPTSPFPVQTTSPAGPAALGSTLIPPPSTTPTLPEGQPVQSELPSDCLPHELPDQTSGAPITPNKSTPLVGFLDEITPENNIPLPRSLTDATYTILPSRPEDPSIAYGLTFSSRTKPPPQVVKFAFVAGSEVPGTPIVPGEPSIDDILTPETSATAEVPAAEEMELFALGKESKLDVASRIPDTSENQIEVSEGASITPSRSSVYSSTAPTPSSHTPSPSSPISTATSISVYPSTAKASPGLPLSGPPWPRPLTKSWADIAKKTQPFKPEVLPAGASKETTDSRDSCEGNGPAVEVLSNQHSLRSHPEPLQRSLPSLHTVLTASPSLSIPAPLTHPRGLVNSGNMCFANVVLQALLHTAPFYKLFDMIGRTLPADLRRRALVDATEFQLESDYPPLQRPPSSGKSTPMIAEQLRQLSWQQDSFIPQALYSALSENKRFDSMKGGLQEDAEEFLGFFLDTLHEELLTALTRLQATSSIGWATSTASHVPASMNEREVHRPVSPVNDDDNDGWMEVGKRNKVTQTRTTKAQESAITRIFGGKLRSVLRVPGLGKDSVTLEPYQPLQLDIQSDDVQNIEDALRHLTKAETVQVTSRGGTVHATKQVFIESLPPVLVIHLKRFIYDGSDVQKSNKVLIYQTLLEIPNDVLAPAQRSRARVQYRLYGVVYHHGKFASGGHYTLDICDRIAVNGYVLMILRLRLLQSPMLSLSRNPIRP
ncbi:uncharacterized protein EI90DRAFT_2665317 [Cantharellus anzutake]|uniref:uncharacterized protein n=1 Tax=Cantharellus anzutake TaxID=1750568 RepID=UPI001904B3C6|nr:uncharacterized protein EI90DRAFT_2665317 [Cantharellus anzutake]KAF8337564.1 hypothetical protein EI90DRAFT_2665317 [Cantharellus anzutake]